MVRMRNKCGQDVRDPDLERGLPVRNYIKKEIIKVMQKENPLKFKTFYNRRLPHIQPEEGIFFITYRLDFTYPEEYLSQLHKKQQEFEKLVLNTAKDKRKRKIEELNKILFDIEDNFLQKINSPQWLSNKEVATIIQDSLFFNHHKAYNLLCYCIMPNHVHVLLKPLKDPSNLYYSLSRIMHNHKSFTAQKCNKILKRTGTFWYPDFYDHYIRNEKELYNVVNYILNNPVKAGLCDNWEDWEFSWMNDDLLSL